jgi:hypothetical protein
MLFELRLVEGDRSISLHTRHHEFHLYSYHPFRCVYQTKKVLPQATKITTKNNDTLPLEEMFVAN